MVMLGWVVTAVLGYHSVTNALYWRPSRRGMLSQKVEVGTAGNVVKNTVEVILVVNVSDVILDTRESYRVHELRQA